MKTSLLLRIAAVVTLIYCAGHTMGMPWTPVAGPQQDAVIDAMKATRFEVMGNTRTYWDFYIGFGLSISGFLALQAVVLWQLASLARRDAKQVRPIVAVFLASFAINAVIVWNFFFAIPLVLAAAAAICLGLALVPARENGSARAE
jgi:hypothetical protein